MAVVNINTLFHRGKMRYVATFQNSTPIPDGAGGQTSVFTNVLTTRCQLYRNSGSEVLAGGQIYYNKTYTMKCGFRGNSLPINIDSIIQIYGPSFPSTTFKIADFQMIDMKAHLYEFTLSASQ